MELEHKTKKQLVAELQALQAENTRLKSISGNSSATQGEGIFRALSEASFEAVFISEKGICIGQNRAAQELFGYPLEEALGRLGTEWIAPDDRQMVMDHMLAGYEEPYRATALRKNGTTFLCEIRGKMIAYQDRKIRVTALRDITTRVQIEESSDQRKQYLESVLRAAPDAIITLDTAYQITEWNPGAEALYGYTKAEALDQNIDKLIAKPDFYKEAVNFSKQVLSGETLPPQETIRYNKAGQSLNVIVAGAPISIAGKFVGGVAAYTDITEQKKAEAALITSEEQLRIEQDFTNAALDAQQDTFFLFEPATGKAIRWNQAFREISGYSDEEIATLPAPSSYYSPEDLEKAGRFIQSVLAQGTGHIQLELITKSGAKVPTEYAVSIITDQDANPKYLISIGRDITKRKLAEARLQESEEKFRAIVTQSQPIIYVIDQAGIFLISEGKGLAALGLKPGQVVGTSAIEMYKDFPKIIDSIERALNGETGRLVVKIGELYFDVAYSPLRNAAGKITSMIGMAIDITELKKTEKDLEFLATHDSLTTLPNRMLFNSRLNQALKRSIRNKTELAVLFLDLDIFKSINDAFGHAAGDDLLQEIARRVQSVLRDNDTVARIGGDEFLILLEEIQEVDVITPIAQKILAEIAKPMDLAEHEVFITGSIGISIFPVDADNVDLLIRHANTAMYRAKTHGNGMFEYFSTDTI